MEAPSVAGSIFYLQLFFGPLMSLSVCRSRRSRWSFPTVLCRWWRVSMINASLCLDRGRWHTSPTRILLKVHQGQKTADRTSSWCSQRDHEEFQEAGLAAALSALTLRWRKLFCSRNTVNIYSESVTMVTDSKLTCWLPWFLSDSSPLLHLNQPNDSFPHSSQFCPSSEQTINLQMFLQKLW